MAAPGVSLKLRQRRRLSQNLSPALQQSMKLLQLSNAGLDAVIREALETNPLLSLDDPPDDAPGNTPVKALRPARRDLAAGYRPTPAAARLFGADSRCSGRNGKLWQAGERAGRRKFGRGGSKVVSRIPVRRHRIFIHRPPGAQYRYRLERTARRGGISGRRYRRCCCASGK